MFKSLSVARRSHRGYEELSDEYDHQDQPRKSSNGNGGLQAQLRRAASVPARIFSPSTKPRPSPIHWVNNEPSNLAPKQVKKASKVYPLFALFDTRSRTKKAATANPQFLRYVEYLKEGGLLGQQNK